MPSMIKASKQKHRAAKKKQIKSNLTAQRKHERQRLLLKKQGSSAT
jgi:hypothetical protein